MAVRWLGGNPPARLLLSSVEGTATDRWPPSPPLQELAVDQRPDRSVAQKTSVPAVARRIALLLGRAGSGHWSASFELRNDPLRLIVDVASRISERPEFIGSTYQAANAPRQPSENGERLELARECNAVATLTQVDGRFRLVPSNPSAFTICPQSMAPPATWRWCYVLTIDRATR